MIYCWVAIGLRVLHYIVKQIVWGVANATIRFWSEEKTSLAYLKNFVMAHSVSGSFANKPVPVAFTQRRRLIY